MGKKTESNKTKERHLFEHRDRSTDQTRVQGPAPPLSSHVSWGKWSAAHSPVKWGCHQVTTSSACLHLVSPSDTPIVSGDLMASPFTRGLEGCWPEAPPLLQHVGFYVEPSVAAGFSQDERSGDRVPMTAAAVPDLVGSPSPPLCTMC